MDVPLLQLQGRWNENGGRAGGQAGRQADIERRTGVVGAISQR